MRSNKGLSGDEMGTNKGLPKAKMTIIERPPKDGRRMKRQLTKGYGGIKKIEAR